MDKERKYELLPGVELPDIDAIKHAASDFSASGIDSVEVKAHAPRIMPDGHPDAATSEEMRRMQALGDQIAADEEKQASESRARMNVILSTAVQAPETLTNLKLDNYNKVSDEDRARIEADLKAEKERKEEEDAKIRAREERRLLQQRMLEEARERASREQSKSKDEEDRLEREDDDGSEDELPEDIAPETVEKNAAEAEIESEAAEEKAAEAESVPEATEEKTSEAESVPEATEEKTSEAEPVPAKNESSSAGSVIASDEETFDDFSEFLDDGDY